MNYVEIIPFRSLQKFNEMCLHNEYLKQTKEFQEQVLSWAVAMLAEARDEWEEIRATTIEAIVEEDRKAQAKKRGQARDNKYAPFRKYFKNLHQEMFLKYHQAGQKLSANRFVEFFLEILSNDIEIPYCQSNLKNKLIQLARANAREFKKAYEC